MMNCFLLMTKTTLFATMPITFCKIIFGKNYLPLQKPHEHFNLRRDLSFPNMLPTKIGPGRARGYSSFSKKQTKIGPEFISSAYMDFMVKTPLEVNLHWNVSGIWFRLIDINLLTKWIHLVHFHQLKLYGIECLKGWPQYWLPMDPLMVGDDQSASFWEDT